MWCDVFSVPHSTLLPTCNQFPQNFISSIVLTPSLNVYRDDRKKNKAGEEVAEIAGVSAEGTNVASVVSLLC